MVSVLDHMRPVDRDSQCDVMSVRTTKCPI